MDEFSQFTQNLKSLFVSINNLESPVLVGVIYKPPSGDEKPIFTELNSLLQKLPLSEVHITGDFNTEH